jgi:F-type H+-transporting ATPase subunit b
VLIDWFTVIAQVVNFLILVWLLKRFLYQPIINALDAREKRIAAELAAAEAKGQEAEKERNEFRQKNDEFDRQRAMLLSNASDEARAERQRLIAAARKDADDLRAKQEEALKREYQSLSEALTRTTCTEVFAVARKVLADLADTTLEMHMAEAFIKRMRELSPAEKAQLASTLGAAGAGVTIRSVFGLPAAQQNALEAVIKETVGVDVPVRFAVEPELVSGIELVSHEYKLTWSIGGYLASLENEVGKLLKQQAEPEPEPEPEAESETGSDAVSEKRDKGHQKIASLKTRT